MSLPYPFQTGQVFHPTASASFMDPLVVNKLRNGALLLGTLGSTQIHSCFCKSLIVSGFGKEGWLWGGNSQASATETEPELRIRRDGGTETEGRRTGRW